MAVGRLVAMPYCLLHQPSTSSREWEEPVIQDVVYDFRGAAAVMSGETEAPARTEPPSSPEEPEKTSFAERIFMKLRFNKSSTAFNMLLLGSQLACEAADRGAELRPDWARGAKVFVEGALAEHFADDLDERDVVIRPEDEEQLNLLLLQWPYRQRPRQQQVSQQLCHRRFLT